MIRKAPKPEPTQSPDQESSLRGSCISMDLPTTEPGVYIYGFIADFISRLKEQMHFDCTIVVANSSTNYHSLVSSVAGDKPEFDMVISNVRITSRRLETVDFSVPIHENTFRILVRQSPYTHTTNLFSCFNPFSWDVWILICAVLIYSGVIIYIFEHQNMPVDPTESIVIKIFTGICRAMSNVVIMRPDVCLTTNASRLTVLSLNGLAIILIAIYTANLSSFLTLSRTQSTLSGIDDIKNGRIPFDRVGIISNSAVSDYYVQNISSTFKPLSSVHEMYDALLNYSIDASIWDSAAIEYAVEKEYCDRLIVVGVGFVRSSLGIALQRNWPYKRDLDSTILSMRESESLGCLEARWFTNRKCLGSSGTADGENPPGLVSFSLDVMSGVFILFFAMTVVAIGVHLWHCRQPITTKFRKTVRRLSTVVFSTTLRNPAPPSTTSEL